MTYYNEFKDVVMGDEVEWVRNSGVVIRGVVTGVCKELDRFNVRWSDTELTNIYETTDNTLDKNMRKAKTNTEILAVTTEDKIKELIVHLVQINQTNRACEVIEVLRKYVAEQKLNGYKLK